MFTILAIIIPINPINKKLPNEVKSLLVVYPYKLAPANVALVIKNTCVILMAVYIAKIRKKKTIKSFMTSKTLGYIMPKSRSIDIDNLKDFKKAENYIKNKTSSI